MVFFFSAPPNAFYTVSEELACCSTVRLCNSIKILTALQPYLTLKLWSSKLHNKWLGKGIKVWLWCVFVCVCGARCKCVHMCGGARYNPQDPLQSHVYQLPIVAVVLLSTLCV